ncbi:MAG: hypothetical protein IPH32_13825 [Bacteroidetes bacterium]|nr:hypothetical protein [Bacteroidota bacterium]
MIAQLGAIAQWTSVPTMFSPFTGQVRSIDVGSTNLVVEPLPIQTALLSVRL